MLSDNRLVIKQGGVKMRKVLSFILSLVMILSVLPMSVMVSAETKSGKTGDCTWTLDGTVLTISGKGYMEDYDYFESDLFTPWYDYTVTEGYVENGVKTIGTLSFYENRNLVKVVIGNDVESIYDFTFLGCEKLKDVTIGTNVEFIGWNAFQDCSSLETVELPKGLIAVCMYSFYNCSNLETVKLPKSITDIEMYAFEGSNIKDVYYQGSKADKNNIEIANGNEVLINATWHYNTCDNKHKYSSDNDTTCNKCDWTREVKSKIKTVKLSKSKLTFNGKTQKPKLVVKDSNGKTVSSKYYTITGDKSAKKIGKYKLTIKFKDKYSGKKTLSYQIVKPTVKKSSVSKLTAAKKSLKISIKKASSVTGYQIEYSTSKSFKSSKKKTTTKTSCTIKSLKAKKTYYVRVRSYKKVGGKTFYSAWSGIKSKKTK